MQPTFWRTALTGAGLTVPSLFGGIALGFAVGSAIFDVLSGHNFTDPNPLHIFFAALPALGGFLAGGAVWGIFVGRMARFTNRKRMAVMGALGFAPITLTLALLLRVLEPLAVQQLGAQFPLHRLFTFFFLPTSFLIAGISAYAIGVGLQDARLARKLGWRVGLAAALAFLCINLTMEALGWRVGAPDAANRATMLTVLFAGNLGAAIVGGAVLALLVTPTPQPSQVGSTRLQT